MNNKERFLWLTGIVLIAFHSIKQSEQISELEVAVTHNNDFETFNLKRQAFYKMILEPNED